MKRFLFVIGTAGVVLSLLITASLTAAPSRGAKKASPSAPAAADGAAAAKPAQAGAAAASSADAQKGKKSDGSELVIPANATIDELFEQANKLLNSDYAFDTKEEYDAWLGKMIQTVNEIADRVLKMDVDDDNYKKGINLKGEILYYQTWAKPETFKSYDAFIRSLKKDARLLKIDGGQKIIDGQTVSFLHEGCVRTVQNDGSIEELQKYVNEFQEIVLRDSEFVSMIPNIVYPVTQMATTKKDPKMMETVFFKFAKAMKDSDDQTLKDAAKGLEGILRFSQLDGKPMKVVGTMANGEKFDPKSLDGRVYLIDFWATWVTPCIAQYPELLALYVQYQDQGFEIIGYNMDEEVEKFKDYMTSKNVPWPSISEKMSTENKQPSLSEFYGITTMPTLILVGKDGKVIKTDIDMDTLKAKLAEEFKEK